MSNLFFYHENSKTATCVPLKDIKYAFNIYEDAYECVCTQEYANENDYPIETFYKYPVYSNATLVGVIAKTFDYKIKCQIKEKEAAKKEYKEAVKNGDQAVMVSEENSEQYDINIGNIKPHQQLSIEFTYLCELQYDRQHGGYKVILPTTITPKYDSKLGSLATNGDNATCATYEDKVEYAISKVELAINLRMPVEDVKCISHEYKLTYSDDKSHVAITNISPDKDVVFILQSEMRSNYAYLTGDILKVHINQQVNHDRFMKENEYTDAMETIFVLDQSGSMYGGQIKIARDLVFSMMNYVRKDKDYVNYYRFGNNFVKKYNNSIIFDNKVQTELQNYITETTKDCMGGTDTYSVLCNICMTSKPTGITRRNIILLTDGEVAGVDEIAKMCRADVNTVMFVMGIGDAISHDFCKALTGNHGYSDVITLNENSDEFIESKAMECMQRSCVEVIDVSYVINGKQVDSTKCACVPPSRYIKVSEPCREVDVIIGENHNVIPVYCEMCPKSPTEKFYHKKIINKMENATYYEQDTEKQNANKKVLIELSKRYNILTRYTSFIGIKKLKDKQLGAEKIEIPLQMPPKYSGSDTGALIVAGGIGICGYVTIDCAGSDLNIDNTDIVEVITPQFADNSNVITCAGSIAIKDCTSISSLTVKPVSQYQVIDNTITVNVNINILDWYNEFVKLGISTEVIKLGNFIVLKNQTDNENGTYVITGNLPHVGIIGYSSFGYHLILMSSNVD